MKRVLVVFFLTLSAVSIQAQRPSSSNPFPTPIPTDRDIISVDFIEFARIPDIGRRQAARLMHMVTEHGTERLFVSDMRGILYSISYDGQSVIRYLDLVRDDRDYPVLSAGRERGMQSFAFHPQFGQVGAPGYGKFYTYMDTPEARIDTDFVAGGNRRAHDTVLLEWTATDASADTFEGSGPRVIFRVAQPYGNHNGGQIGFNPLAQPGDEDFGLLYVGLADGGSGGDPMNVSQDLGNAFGKILRIDPLGSNSENNQYGVPASNPFVSDGDNSTLGEIYAYGMRNPQRFNWDPANGRMWMADIGQNQVEEISEVIVGGNLGWNRWQ